MKHFYNLLKYACIRNRIRNRISNYYDGFGMNKRELLFLISNLKRRTLSKVYQFFIFFTQTPNF